MPRYWECPSCRALLTRERLEAAAGVCPYCDARVGPAAEFADPDAPPAPAEGGRRLAPVVVPPTAVGKLATAARLLGEMLPLVAALVVVFKLPANAGVEMIVERRAAGMHPLTPLVLKGLVELFFEPLTTAALLHAVAARMAGGSLSFQVAARAGVDSWARLFAARLIKVAFILAVGLGAFVPELGPARVLFAIPMLVLVIRYSLVDEAVVLEHTPVLDSRRRSSELVSGRWMQVVAAGIGSLAILLILSRLIGGWADRVGLLGDPLARALLDTLFDLLAVYYSIALFLIYWEARADAEGEYAFKPALEEDNS